MATIARSAWVEQLRVEASRPTANPFVPTGAPEARSEWHETTTGSGFMANGLGSGEPGGVPRNAQAGPKEPDHDQGT